MVRGVLFFWALSLACPALMSRALAEEVYVTETPARERYVAEPYVKDLGWGLAATASNLFYFPAKTLYALGGGLVGGMAYGLTAGNFETAQSIWSPSVGGTWVLTPEMLSGKRPVFFSGESYEPRQVLVETQ